jgi:phenylpropionate dioxygenase-like ring-hydroxylating dioxygenase large terminal subunit
MFINNWYVACIDSEITATPKQVRMLAHNFVLFRDDADEVHCLSDSCVHRGASLSLGECKNGNLMCPQHGWEYAGNGKCTFIPAGTKTPTETPKRARVPSYPVAAKYGLIFVFLGNMSESERPPIPDMMPEWDTDDWHKDVIPRKKDINYMRMSENYNDPCHVHYVHEFAKWLPKGVTIVDHELTDHYVRSWHAAWNADGKHSLSSGLMMEYNVISCVSRNTNYQPDYPMQIVTAYVTPIDDYNTQIHMVILMPKNERTVLDGSTIRAASAAEHKFLIEMTRDQVMDEDYAVLKTTRPIKAAAVTEELLVESDRTLVQARNMTVTYGEEHGMIDTRALEQLADAHITVIPCPDHKADPKNWVHKQVPLVGKTGKASLKVAS